MGSSRVFSVLILTRNEERNLERCLRAISWAEDVVVFDSHSTDRTVAVAEAMGARVFQRIFDGYGPQREAARTQVDYQFPWVLALDADEIPDEELVAELMRAARADDSRHAAYRMRRKDHFMDRWIKHSTLYPTWFLRFYRPDKIRYDDRLVHEYPAVEGSVGELAGHLLHYAFHKGYPAWLAKHRHYARLEAQAAARDLDALAIDWRGLVVRADPIRRRRAHKRVFGTLPFRPGLRFGYMYLARRGFLDGWRGLLYCSLMFWYESLIGKETRALRDDPGR